MDNAVAIAALGITGTAIGGLIWALKFISEKFLKATEQHTKAAALQAATNQEMLTFMRNLNGRLKKTVKEKLNECERNNEPIQSK